MGLGGTLATHFFYKVSTRIPAKPIDVHTPSLLVFATEIAAAIGLRSNITLTIGDGK